MNLPTHPTAPQKLPLPLALSVGVLALGAAAATTAGCGTPSSCRDALSMKLCPEGTHVVTTEDGGHQLPDGGTICAFC